MHRGEKRLFAAIGILHMIGDRAVQRLLVARGFTIERVWFADNDQVRREGSRGENRDHIGAAFRLDPYASE